ncbi:hypothetical protein [Providencia alcalifaciens]|uniref:hypothetical protein n=1 Tax=Providencia alcalifaciens TaxID=126385 RepID=UPI001CC7C65F|nr:hypothetical protein [Providencia alcalifaciens]CAG9421846.1 hypothetical protein NVI2019_GHJFPKLH_02079 [Providencia alcalifaciens]
MKNLKSLILVSSLLAVSFSTFAYHGNGYHRNGNGPSQAQYDRPCDGNYRGQHMGRHQGMMQYSTAVQTTQPEEALKKITAEVPKGESNKKYMVKVAVVEISPSLVTQEAQ